MAVNFKNLRDCDPSTMSGVAAQWADAKEKLGDAHLTATGIDSKMRQGAWFGRAADAAVQDTSKFLRQLSAGRSEAETIKGIIDDAAELFAESRRKLWDALDTINADESLRVDMEGKVRVEPSGALAELSGACKAQILADKEVKAERLQTDIELAVAEARSRDERAAEALLAACEYDSASSDFNPETGFGLWLDPKYQRFGAGSLYELSGFIGYRDEHDFGREGKLEWKVGGQANAGIHDPDSPSADPGQWVNAFGGFDLSYKAPTTDFGMDGVAANLDLNAQFGAGQGYGVNDPRIYDVDVNGSEVRIQSNALSHSFKNIPLTVGINVDVTVDLAEYQNNWINDTIFRPRD